jgi:hypothetical protein
MVRFAVEDQAEPCVAAATSTVAAVEASADQTLNRFNTDLFQEREHCSVSVWYSGPTWPRRTYRN